MNWIPVLTGAVWLLSLIFIVYCLYFVAIAVFALKRHKACPEGKVQHRFAAVIAARNEEKVIGNLIQSLKQQNYPEDLLDIIVVPNNCTDQTKEVALKNGALVMEPTYAVKNKGQALTYVFDEIFANNDIYDAFCFFDADNLVHPDFFRKMNDALCSGIKLAQGYRDSKNPSDTCTSSCYSLYYLTINRFMNHARSALGMSASINGSGFMVHADILRENGGWHTKTMAEDIEFTAQCVLKGHKVAWVPEARIYDEQPLGILQSWKQRRRWSSGILQTLQVYFKDLAKGTVSHNGLACFDIIVYLMAPIMQAITCLIFLISSVLGLMYVNYALFPQRDLFYAAFFSCYWAYFFTVLMMIVCVLMEKKSVLKMAKGILTFWIFVMMWVPINIISIFNKPKVWKQVQHTRDVTISEITMP